MTFVLQNYENMKQKFVNTDIDALLNSRGLPKYKPEEKPVLQTPEERRNAGIQQLDDNRKQEVLYILAAIKELDEQIATQKSAHFKPNEILYGAILTTCKDIEKRTSSLNGFGVLHDNLQRTMGLINAASGTDKKITMELSQNAACCSAFNAFLNVLYKDNNPLNGFKDKHIFSEILPKHLTEFSEISASLEAAAQAELIISYSKEVKPKISKDPSVYKVVTPIDPTAITFTSWSELQKVYFNVKTEECKRYGGFYKLSAQRKIQYTFLDNLEKKLNLMGLADNEKIAYFAAAMYVVTGDIAANEYSKEALYSKDISAFTFNEFNKKLQFDNAKPAHIEMLLTSLNRLLLHIFVETYEVKGKPATTNANKETKTCLREDSVFTKEFNPLPYLTLLPKMIAICRRETAKLCEPKIAPACEPKIAPAKASSFLPKLTGFFHSKAAKQEITLNATPVIQQEPETQAIPQQEPEAQAIPQQEPEPSTNASFT